MSNDAREFGLNRPAGGRRAPKQPIGEASTLPVLSVLHDKLELIEAYNRQHVSWSMSLTFRDFAAALGIVLARYQRTV